MTSTSPLVPLFSAPSKRLHGERSILTQDTTDFPTCWANDEVKQLLIRNLSSAQILYSFYCYVIVYFHFVHPKISGCLAVLRVWAQIIFFTQSFHSRICFYFLFFFIQYVYSNCKIWYQILCVAVSELPAIKSFIPGACRKLIEWEKREINKKKETEEDKLSYLRKPHAGNNTR